MLLNGIQFWCECGRGRMRNISVAIVGDSKCGKTQLINRFMRGSFSEVMTHFYV